MGTPLLIDVGCLCDEHTDAALEFMAKAVGEDPPGADIWEPHPNPFVRRIVELFSERGLARHAGLEAELRSWLAGDGHQPSLERPPRPAGAMVRWSEAEIVLTRAYLRALPGSAWQISDWELLVDYLVQRYLPAGDIRAEAEWLATRSNMMGRVQAAMGEATGEEADTILATLPALGDGFTLSPVQLAAIDFGRARCCESVAALTDALRHRMRRVVVDHQEAILLGDRAAAAESLQTKLLDTFGTLNRDWRRIAVTEATENVNQGMVAATPAGAKLRRVEKYRGACAFCRSIDGRVFTVVDPSKPDKDGELEVWVGKTNVGRSASPRKRLAGGLVEREPHEMWWPPAGAAHPNCRGRWIAVGGASADPEFDAWLADLKRKGRS